MFRSPLRIAAASALAVFASTGAWADLAQTSSSIEVSQDLFGTGSDAIEIATTDDAEIILTTDAAIGDGNIADLTFNIVNGQFASIVPLSTISVSAGVAAFTKTAGGNAGDSSVTFQVEIVTTVPANEDIIFAVPTLTGVSISDPTMDVVIGTSSIVPTTTAPDPFPNEIDGTDCDPVTPCLLVTAGDPYSAFDVGAGADGLVDIEDRPEIFSPVNMIDVDGEGTMRNGLLLGVHSLDLDTISPPRQRDGSDWSIAISGDGVGTITLTALGNFRDGDIVFADVANAGVIDPGESFTISGSEATIGGLALTDVEGADINIIYVPNETDDLAPETFALSAEITYALASNVARSTAAQTAPATISFDGIDVEGYAYGVVRAGGTDRSFVRVTNEESSSVSVFFSCVDDAGNSSFGDFGFLDGNETEAYDSDELGAILGTFTGRGACDILSDGNLSVQHKIRSSDILTDNSVVIGRDINPD